MSIAVLPEAPDIERSCVPPDASLPPDQLGKYSVGDPAFIRQATATLMQRCVLRGCALPQHVVSSLQLVNGDCNAIGMANALLSLADLEERRAVICEIVHAIVRLKKFISSYSPFPMSWPHEVLRPAQAVPEVRDSSAFMRDHMQLSSRYARLVLEGHTTLHPELHETLGLNGQLTGPLLSDALLSLSDDQRAQLKNLMRNELFVHLPR